METTERQVTPRKYPSKYELILMASPVTINYVEMIQKFEALREQRRIHSPQYFSDDAYGSPWNRGVECDFIRLHGGRQTGATLAIHEMATQATDLIFIKDLMRIKAFQERQYHHSDAVFAIPNQALYREIKSSENALRVMKMTDSFHPAIPAGTVPKRIFIDDSSVYFDKCFTPKEFFRWLHFRFGTDPLVIAL